MDPNGAVLSRGGFTAWGSPIGTLSPSTPMGWKGRIGDYLDSETGLIYMRARYYASSLGRFITRDPVGFAGDINLYGYCGGDPINFVDALGLEYTFLGLRRGTIAGIISGGVTLVGSCGNLPLAMGVGFGVRGAVNSYDDGNSLGQAAFDGAGHFCMGWVGGGLMKGGGAIVTGLIANRMASNPAAVSMEANTATQCAGGSQGNAVYTGVDAWEARVLPAGTLVAGGTPGQTAFYTSSNGIASSNYSASVIFRSLQVRMDPTMGYRPGMTIYSLTQDSPVAYSQVWANPQFGPGGASQYFIPNYIDVLTPLYSIRLNR